MGVSTENHFSHLMRVHELAIVMEVARERTVDSRGVVRDIEVFVVHHVLNSTHRVASWFVSLGERTKGRRARLVAEEHCFLRLNRIHDHLLFDCATNVSQ